jgi:hypothetical protein
LQNLRNHRSFIQDLTLTQYTRVIELHVRTVAAIMMWSVVALLILNKFLLKSGWIWLISIALIIMAVIAYFIPRLRK